MRPAAYQAPSWSWASVNSQVRFWSLDISTAQPISNLLRVELSLASLDPFGAVSKGSLDIQGPLMAGFGTYIIDRQSANLEGNVTLNTKMDFPNLVEDFAQLLYLPLYGTENSDVFGLLLELTVTKRGEYTRAGIAWIHNSDWKPETLLDCFLDFCPKFSREIPEEFYERKSTKTYENGNQLTTYTITII